MFAPSVKKCGKQVSYALCHNVTSAYLRGYIHLCLRKKADFYNFFWKNNTFFFKTERLFIYTCRKIFHEFFQKKKFIAGVNIAIVLKHNFFDISCGEHDKEGTAYLKYTKQKQNCSWYLYAVRERRILRNSFFYKNGDRFSNKCVHGTLYNKSMFFSLFDVCFTGVKFVI